MKLDMHCHTKEGSLDGKVPVEKYIELLKSQGFQGMLITDHDTYNGYRHWKNEIKGKKHKDFLVLKGIEYDTFGGGHILVIMPENVKLRCLELRGMPTHLLISIVHTHGGILGPAHPCGEKYMSLCRTRAYKKDPAIVNLFDFVESFNSCEPRQANETAHRLAQKYGKAEFGGSDSHKANCVGRSYTILPDDITCESDLIRYIKEGGKCACGGSLYRHTTKDKIGKANKLLVFSFYFYNKLAGLFRARKRYIKLQHEYLRQEKKL